MMTLREDRGVEAVGGVGSKSIKFPSNTNDSPEVQGHQLQESVLFYFILHLTLQLLVESNNAC